MIAPLTGGAAEPPGPPPPWLAAALRAAGEAVPERIRPLASRHGTNLLFALEGRGQGRAGRVLKLYRGRHGAAIESQALAAVAATCSPAEVPALFRVFSLQAEGESRPAVLMGRLSGRAWRVVHDGPGHRRVERLGDLLRRVHQAPVPAGFWGSLAEPAHRAPSWQGWLSAVAARTAAGLAGRGLLPAGAAEALGAATAVVPAGEALRSAVPALLHCDLIPDNLLAGAGGHPRLLDFERARVGHWAYDLVKLSRRVWHGCPECAAAFAQGYGYDPRDAALAALLPLYDLVFDLEMAAYLAGHLHGPEDGRLLEELLGALRRRLAEGEGER